MMTDEASFTTVTFTPDEIELLTECIASRGEFYDSMIDAGPDDYVRGYFDSRRDDCHHLLDVLYGRAD